MTDNPFNMPPEDPTLLAVRAAVERAESNRTPSRRVGGSSIGGECLRAGWLGFRWVSPVVIKSQGLLAINDGHRSEDVMATLLRMVPGVELWTEDPTNPGKQIEFGGVDGHFVGKLDGVIRGILQAPVTPHIWEHKAVNEKKFNLLNKAIEKYGEKNALEQWDMKYFAQAQMYMDGMGMDRHYLTVSTPGVRDFVSVRTELQPKQVVLLKEKASRIAFGNRSPSRISQDPAFFGCKFCDHADNCHGSKLPQINCRTCVFAEAVVDGKWMCRKHNIETDYDMQQRACARHRFHPDMVPGEALAQGENDLGQSTFAYKLRDGTGFRDDDKAGRPAHPVIPMEVKAAVDGEWFCTGCGLVYKTATHDLQCDSCSGHLEVVK